MKTLAHYCKSRNFIYFNPIVLKRTSVSLSRLAFNKTRCANARSRECIAFYLIVLLRLFRKRGKSGCYCQPSFKSLWRNELAVYLGHFRIRFRGRHFIRLSCAATEFTFEIFSFNSFYIFQTIPQVFDFDV